MFLTPLEYRNAAGGKILTLTSRLIYVTDDRKVITVPRGFTCDGQSYPRLLWFIDHPQGAGAKAGVLHDYLYRLNGKPDPETGLSYSRKESDRIFREALKSSGVNWVSRSVRYTALRLFGWMAWEENGERVSA